MSRASAAFLLWVSAWLILPLPYFIVANGRVPVVRFTILSAITVAYAGLVDGSGVAWAMASILLSHVLVYSILLAIAAVLIARCLPANLRRPIVWIAIAIGFATVLLFNVYRTPFDDASIHSNWIGLFQ